MQGSHFAEHAGCGVYTKPSRLNVGLCVAGRLVNMSIVMSTHL